MLANYLLNSGVIICSGLLMRNIVESTITILFIQFFLAIILAVVFGYVEAKAEYDIEKYIENKKKQSVD